MVLIQEEGTKAKGLQKLLKMKLGCKLQIVVTFFFEKEPLFFSRYVSNYNCSIPCAEIQGASIKSTPDNK